jgi:hypothetical protein
MWKKAKGVSVKRVGQRRPAAPQANEKWQMVATQSGG